MNGFQWRRMRAMARTEWTHLRRDRQSLGVILLLPLVTLIIYGFAINFDLKHIPLGILDRDNSVRSRAIRDAFTGSEYFRFEGMVPAESDVDHLYRRGLVRVVLVIPRGFDADVAAGRKVALQAIYDGSDTTTASIAIAYAEAQVADVLGRQARAVMLRRVPRARREVPRVDVHPRILYNPELDSTHYIVPGLLVIILSITSALLTSTTVAREREQGTLEGLVVSPIQPLELMAGKLLPYVGASMADVLLLLLLGWFLFGIWPAGSITLLMVGMLLFLAGVLGLGLAISARAPNQAFALQFGFVMTLLPTLLLSGFAFPRQSMPTILYYLTMPLPATQFLIVVRGIYLKGTGLSLLWPQLLWLAFTAALLLRLASVRFVKRLD